jgi:hypothetical protein
MSKLLAKLKLDNNVVLAMAWANPNQRKVGDVTEDGFTVYEVSETEYNAYVPNHTKFIDGHLVVDDDYIPPVIDTTIEPSVEQQQLAELTKSNSQQVALNAQLIKQVAALQSAQSA